MTEPLTWPALSVGERRISKSNEGLYRQIHPRWIRDGQITTQAFKPTSKDNGKLSIRLASHMSSEEAYGRHTAMGLASSGTFEVTVGEVEEAGLRSINDSEAEHSPFGHGYIDTRASARSLIAKAAKHLKECAMLRGTRFDPLAQPHRSLGDRR